MQVRFLSEPLLTQRKTRDDRGFFLSCGYANLFADKYRKEKTKGVADGFSLFSGPDTKELGLRSKTKSCRNWSTGICSHTSPLKCPQDICRLSEPLLTQRKTRDDRGFFLSCGYANLFADKYREEKTKGEAGGFSLFSELDIKELGLRSKTKSCRNWPTGICSHTSPLKCPQDICRLSEPLLTQRKTRDDRGFFLSCGYANLFADKYREEKTKGEAGGFSLFSGLDTKELGLRSKTKSCRNWSTGICSHTSPLKCPQDICRLSEPLLTQRKTRDHRGFFLSCGYANLSQKKSK